jgi:hypothetical protein
VALRHRTIEGVVAAAPWVLVLLGFSLMLTMLRQSRGQHAVAKEPAEAVEPAYPVPGPAELPEATVPDTRALPAGVWGPEAAPEPEFVPVPEAEAAPQAEVPAEAEWAGEPEAEVPAELAETGAALGADAPEAGTTDMPVAQDAAVGAGTEADADAAGDNGPVEPVEEEPVTAAAADEEPAREPEPAAAAYQDSTPTTPYNYWDSGADGGFAEPGRVPTVPGEVIDDDAPPFATAPFATVPRLNRVRSTPTPPEEDDEEE